MNLLVVEDDTDTREMFTLVLEMAGHTGRTAKDGAEALAVAETFCPDVIFPDIEMPKVNGYAVCQHLRRLPGLEKARIYAVSGLTGATHERRCVECGFNGQLSRPADPASFARLLNLDCGSVVSGPRAWALELFPPARNATTFGSEQTPVSCWISCAHEPKEER